VQDQRAKRIAIIGEARSSHSSRCKFFATAEKEHGVTRTSINYNHIMPTRYTLELEGLKGTLSNDTFKEVSQREEAKKTVKKTLEERYLSGKNRWFFTPLRM
jgi:ribosomal protein L14E/L6E/L27E